MTVIEELRVDTLKPAPGSNKRHKRKGRGIAAGQGASCGFGMRGQKSRSGPGVRAGFEGGQTPLYRRIPKFVGRPMGPGHKKKVGDAIADAMDHGRACPRWMHAGDTSGLGGAEDGACCRGAWRLVPRDVMNALHSSEGAATIGS